MTTTKPRRRAPITGRFVVWVHRRKGHKIVKWNDRITVPSFDPSAVGILAECSCRKVWAW